MSETESFAKLRQKLADGEIGPGSTRRRYTPCRHAVLVGIEQPDGSTRDECADCGLPWDWCTKDVVRPSGPKPPRRWMAALKWLWTAPNPILGAWAIPEREAAAYRRGLERAAKIAEQSGAHVFARDIAKTIRAEIAAHANPPTP